MRLKKRVSASLFALLLANLALGLSSPLARAEDEVAGCHASSKPSTQSELINDIFNVLHESRRFEVCGTKYTWTQDSLTDFSPEASKPFSGRIKILADPHEALLARLMTIRHAKRSIQLSTFILQPDLSTKAVLEELRRAIARGVSVQILVDSLGSLNSRDPLHEDIKSLFQVNPGVNPITHQKATVDAVMFNPVLKVSNVLDWIGGKTMHLLSAIHLVPVGTGAFTTSINIDRRDHDKILLVDGDDHADSIAIVGGRNLQDSYFEVPEKSEGSFSDMEIMVRDQPGSAAGEDLQSTVGAYYRKLICHKGNRWLRSWLPSKLALNPDGSVQRLLAIPGLARLASKMKPAGELSFLDTDLRQGLVRFVNEGENILRPMRSNIRNPIRNGDSYTRQFHKMLKSADQSIDIVSPYLYLTDNEINGLKSWLDAKPGRKLRIFTYSPLTVEDPMTQEFIETRIGPTFMNPGIYSNQSKDGRITWHAWDNSDHRAQVFELGGDDSQRLGGKVIYGMLHAKYVIVDGKKVLVGSDNFDLRSRHLDSESGFYVESVEAAMDLTTNLKAQLKYFCLWGSPEWHKLVDDPRLKNRMVRIDRSKALIKAVPSLRSFF